jgi:hypothetical protein
MPSVSSEINTSKLREYFDLIEITYSNYTRFFVQHISATKTEKYRVIKNTKRFQKVYYFQDTFLLQVTIKI